MRIHLIAIGGAVMHNLALELKANGHQVTGSDDEIYDPAYSRLQEQGLLPEQFGWNEDSITKDIDLVILGMHAQQDNPELLKSQELGVSVQSFPEFVAGHIRNKIKIVVCGSHGKTTTTSMIMHVLKKGGYDFDYLVGGLVPGFDRMVRLSDSSPIAVIEGDEYLSSRIDPRPKMHLYRGNIIIVTGIAWDHMNVFPTFENYEEQFESLLKESEHLKRVFWFGGDIRLADLVRRSGCREAHEYEALLTDLKGNVVYNGRSWPITVFGQHNLANMHAAALACREIGVNPEDFLDHIKDFTGSGKRLELISKDPPVYRDFAHAPSKVKATTDAVREKYPRKRILAITELHTYSSLNKKFLPHYKGSLKGADKSIVFFDPHAIKMKRLEPLEPSFIAECFNHANLIVCDAADDFANRVKQEIGKYDVILIMSSGNLGGLDPNDFIPPEN